MNIFKTSLLFLATLFVVAKVEAYTHNFRNNSGRRINIRAKYTACNPSDFDLEHGQGHSEGVGLCALEGVIIREGGRGGSIIYDNISSNSPDKGKGPYSAAGSREWEIISLPPQKLPNGMIIRKIEVRKIS
ncbi:hypothetical protein M1446_04530 [Candidatus Dependentiae bacterium]|nr:hypothetical protein [Candidatus Dependentiae bacterium]